MIHIPLWMYNVSVFVQRYFVSKWVIYSPFLFNIKSEMKTWMLDVAQKSVILIYIKDILNWLHSQSWCEVLLKHRYYSICIPSNKGMPVIVFFCIESSAGLWRQAHDCGGSSFNSATLMCLLTEHAGQNSVNKYHSCCQNGRNNVIHDSLYLYATVNT